MISSSFFSVRLYPDDSTCLELGVTDLGADSLTFFLPVTDPRLPEHPPRAVCTCRGLTFREERTFSILTLSAEESDRYRTLYRLVMEDSGAVPFMRSVIKDLTTYTVLKNDGSDATLSAFYTSYPEDCETDFPKDFPSWRARILSSAVPDPGWKTLALSLPPVQVALCFPSVQKRFMTEPFPDFFRGLISESGLEGHPLSSRLPAGVCFGNVTCPLLFPSVTELASLIHRCSEQTLSYSVLFPPIPENRLDSFAKLAGYLASADLPKPERVIVNDWGFARLLSLCFPRVFRVYAGPLLARSGKDPRQAFRKGTEKSLLSSSDSFAFRKLLRETGLSGVLKEACGLPEKPVFGDLLTFPFFRLTAATRCTLRSAVRYGARGLQPEDDICDFECEKACFGYGQALNMIGRGNALCSVDTRFLTDSAYAASLLSAGPEVMILDLLE